MPGSDETYDLSLAVVGRDLSVTRRTVLRWVGRGIQTPGGPVRLEARRVGGFYRTSLAAVNRFLAALNCVEEGAPVVRTPAQRDRAVADARRRLEEMGVNLAGWAPGDT